MTPEELATRKGFVYAIRCVPNGRAYVGSSVEPKRRFYLHRRDLIAGNHHSPILQAAWNKYGSDAFVFEVVADTTGKENMLRMEQEWIDSLGKCAMNCAKVAGSPLGVKRSPEQRAAHSARMKARYATPEGRAEIERMHATNRGRKQSPEERAMRSALLKGRKMGREWTDDERAAHSVALTGRKMPPMADETRRKISSANKGRKAHPNTKAASRVRAMTWINAERDSWMAMVASGLGFREIERRTGRCRKVIARECGAAKNV